ncbi:MAG: branched-chain amino acid ABC transporter permease, partial [Thermomicrobiales bacterium]
MELAASAFGRLRSSRAANVTWPRQTPWLIAGALAIFTVWSALSWPQQFMTGLIVGSLYALSAVGLTLIYSIARTPHFAHGDSMMLTAYITFFALTGVLVGADGPDARLPIRLDQLPGATDQIWRFSFGYAFLLAMLVAVLVAIPLLLAINAWVYKPLLARNSGTAIVAVASLGIAIAMRGFILLIWGATPRKYVTGIRDTVEVWRFPRVVADQYFILVASLLLTIIVSWILFRTRLGTSMRAMADNPDLARASGIITAHVTR